MSKRPKPQKTAAIIEAYTYSKKLSNPQKYGKNVKTVEIVKALKTSARTPYFKNTRHQQ